MFDINMDSPNKHTGMMADEGGTADPSDHKDGEESVMKPSENQDDVFVNGESNGSKNAGLLHPGYGNSSSEKAVLPRRSSLIKDASRRRGDQRKKTVSFSSMPNEKSVINGRS